MTSERWKQVKTLLDQALDCAPDERAAFLKERSGGDEALRDEVASLLNAYDDGAVFFSEGALPNEEPFSPVEAPMEEGATVGPYRLTEVLGRGGMGTVYRAVRDDTQYEREVALKVIRPGLYTGEARRRFRSERQILASLEHARIARLYGSGLTSDGRPYFAMELVNGTPLDRHCDEARLALDARLRLFDKVAGAVAYAHRQLVVHRDLKPSNILVTPEGEPKLLDFGIAKLLRADELNGRAAPAPLTRTGQHLMTPEYAAPEQVRGEAVTPATDVYALGVLLYRLLTGRQPYRFEKRTPSHVERVICETQPARPSTVASQTAEGDDAPAPPSRLKHRLRGDLDRIVLKALRKEPERRYASAAELADDLRRHREGLPVKARPATWRYHTSKFVRRHRWGVAAAAALALLLVGYAATVSVQTRRLAAERDRAQAEAQKAEQVSRFLTSLFESGDPNRVAGDTLTAYHLLRRGTRRADVLESQPQVQAQMFDVIGRAYSSMGDFAQAESLFEKSLRLQRTLHEEPHREVVTALQHLAEMHNSRRSFQNALPLLREALAMQRALPDGAPLDHATLTMNLATTLRDVGRPDSAETLARQALTLFRTNAAPVHEQAQAQTDLAYIVRGRGRLAEAESLYYDILPTWRSLAASDSSYEADFATVLNNVAYLHAKQGRDRDAIPLYREALALQRRLDKGGHRFTVVLMNNLAAALEREERFAEVLPLRRKVIATEQQHRPEGHWRIASAQGALGIFYMRRGAPSRAEPLLRAQYEKYARGLGPDHSWTHDAAFEWGVALALLDRRREAEPLLRQKHFSREERPRPLKATNRYLLRQLAQRYADWGNQDRAAHYRRILAGAAPRSQ